MDEHVAPESGSHAAPRRNRVLAAFATATALALVAGLVWVQAQGSSSPDDSATGEKLDTSRRPTYLVVGDEVGAGLARALTRWAESNDSAQIIDLTEAGCGVSAAVEPVAVEGNTVWSPGSDCPTAVELAAAARDEDVAGVLVALGPTTVAGRSTVPSPTSDSAAAAGIDPVQAGLFEWATAFRNAQVPQLWMSPPELRVGVDQPTVPWSFLPINSTQRRDFVTAAMTAMATPEPRSVPAEERIVVMNVASWEQLAWPGNYHRPDGLTLDDAAADEQVEKLVLPALWVLQLPARDASSLRPTVGSSSTPQADTTSLAPGGGTAGSTARAAADPQAAAAKAAQAAAANNAAKAAQANNAAKNAAAAKAATTKAAAAKAAANKAAAAKRKAELAAARKGVAAAQAKATAAKHDKARKLIEVLRLKRYRAALQRLEARRKRREQAALHEAPSKGGAVKDPTEADANGTDGDDGAGGDGPGDDGAGDGTGDPASSSVAESTSESVETSSTVDPATVDDNDNGIPDVDEE